MFKRVERKRKRREEEEELGLDEDTKDIMGLNDTDSDESDSGSEQENAQSYDPDPGLGEDGEEDAASEDEDINDEPTLSVAEALKDPIYLISLDPTVHGCVLCKGKLIKNAGMASAHKNANVHRRRFEQFRLLSADADPHSNAWEIVRVISNIQRVESQETSKRALKRQVKQAAIREKRKRHNELKAKAIAKKASKKPSAADETKPPAPFKANLRCAPGPVSQNQPGKTRKRQKSGSKTSTNRTWDATAKSALHTKTPSDGKKSVPKSGIKSTRKANKPS